jgi:hypothetical protein
LVPLVHEEETPAAAGENKTSSDEEGEGLRTAAGACQDRAVECDRSDDLMDDALSERWLRISAIGCR